LRKTEITRKKPKSREKKTGKFNGIPPMLQKLASRENESLDNESETDGGEEGSGEEAGQEEARRDAGEDGAEDVLELRRPVVPPSAKRRAEFKAGTEVRENSLSIFKNERKKNPNALTFAKAIETKASDESEAKLEMKREDQKFELKMEEIKKDREEKKAERDEDKRSIREREREDRKMERKAEEAREDRREAASREATEESRDPDDDGRKV
jgi:hypothetical protein